MMTRGKVIDTCKDFLQTFDDEVDYENAGFDE